MVPRYFALVSSYLEWCVQFWVLHFRKDVAKLETVKRRIMRVIIRGLDAHKKMLRELAMFSMEKRTQGRHVFVFFKYSLKDCYMEEGKISA